MRAIESAIIKAMDGAPGHYSLSQRDTVDVYTEDGLGNMSRYAVYTLWYSKVATHKVTSYTNTLTLGLDTWRSVTTKSRINAIATAFGVPGIVQKNRVWTWTDGVPYTGKRVFIF